MTREGLSQFTGHQRPAVQCPEPADHHEHREDLPVAGAEEAREQISKRCIDSREIILRNEQQGTTNTEM